jgi:hypothetical protein
VLTRGPEKSAEEGEKGKEEKKRREKTGRGKDAELARSTF